MSRVNMDPVKHWIDGRQVDSAEADRRAATEGTKDGAVEP